jgi:hypothetical protein
MASMTLSNIKDSGARSTVWRNRVVRVKASNKSRYNVLSRLVGPTRAATFGIAGLGR